MRFRWFPWLAPLVSILAASPAAASSCSIESASPWIQRWLSAWELTSTEILHLADAPAPAIVFFDSICVYTTCASCAPGAKAVDGPALRGTKLSWYVAAHGDSILTPAGAHLPVGIMSFTSSARRLGPYFVMSAPSEWERYGITKPGDPPTGVFIHEFTHTRQVKGMSHVIGPIDSTWTRIHGEELDDDAVQKRFGKDSVYVAAYLEERDLLYRAAAAPTNDSCRALTREALAMVRARHARWFTGDDAVYEALDDTWLSLEGAAQWAAVAWLSHPKGGGMTREAAIAKMLGKRRWWVQDEGLAVFLVVDRLLPSWPALVFREPSIGASELLEAAAR